jgi:hypothetical protein
MVTEYVEEGLISCITSYGATSFKTEQGRDGQRCPGEKAICNFDEDALTIHSDWDLLEIQREKVMGFSCQRLLHSESGGIDRRWRMTCAGLRPHRLALCGGIVPGGRPRHRSVSRQEISSSRVRLRLGLGP